MASDMRLAAVRALAEWLVAHASTSGEPSWGQLAAELLRYSEEDDRLQIARIANAVLRQRGDAEAATLALWYQLQPHGHGDPAVAAAVVADGGVGVQLAALNQHVPAGAPSDWVWRCVGVLCMLAKQMRAPRTWAERAEARRVVQCAATVVQQCGPTEPQSRQLAVLCAVLVGHVDAAEQAAGHWRHFTAENLGKVFGSLGLMK